MIDLGQYAVEVSAAYTATFALLGGLVAVTFWRGRRIKRALAEAEARAGAHADG